MNLTLVALYGAKPKALSELVLAIQAELSNHLGDAFTPYTMEQIHATLVGLEGYRTAAGILNTNLLTTEGSSCPMDLEGLFRFMLRNALLPLKIRIGGFEQFRDYAFTSRGQHPYVRSFAIHREEAVVIGWPVNDHKYPMSLDHLRRRCMDYNVLHKYHQSGGDVDNDLFLVLGRLRRDGMPPEAIIPVEQRVRELLSSRQPLDLTIGAEALSVVAYEDPSLPITQSRAYPLSVAQDKVEILAGFYEQQ